MDASNGNMAMADGVGEFLRRERELRSRHGEEQVVHRGAAVHVLTPSAAGSSQCRRVAQGSRNCDAVAQEVEAVDPGEVRALLHSQFPSNVM